VSALPAPFDRDAYELVRRGVFDGDEEVWRNRQGDFAFLHPRPETDYAAYVPRVSSLALTDYKKTRPVIARRFEKIAGQLGEKGRVLELGAADAAFLHHVAVERPGWELACVEVDQNTRAARDALSGLVQYETLEAAAASGDRFDRVCAFHVLEHVLEPAPFLRDCARCLLPGGRVIFEVPSLDDPLLWLYRCEAYEAFYFQRQHPYVYSAASLGRLLEENGFQVVETIHHQRYGLENHLQWLTEGKPGGRERFRELFADREAGYLADLERSGRADTAILVAELAGAPR
ncbi:MAG: class I SAM-dependent methyltransferase, partial [Myxococcales bacterium]|nr:class I SAM-dependent methyltransferase [Myxococcales bacterium]